MPIQITAVRMSGGNAHEHIVHLWWTNPADGATGDNTRAQVVAWIENKGGQAFTRDANGRQATVAVVTPPRGAKYLRTHADGVWTDNLLALPRR